jgi:YebC/PmpR family DNA-binding regulatory protein
LARSNLYGKLSKLIITAIRSSGGETDPSLNLSLASALAQARQAQMPKHNIEQALKKGSQKGGAGSEDLDSIVYEGMGPEGVACLVEALTGNRNKTFNEVRHIFKEYGSLGDVAYLFKKSGFVLVELGNDQDLEKGTEDAIDTDLVLDVNEDLDSKTMQLETEINSVLSLKSKMEAKGYKVVECDVRFEPLERAVDVNDGDTFEKFLEEMEGLDEVVRVHHNALL